MQTLGIDASHWQPQMDWERLRQAGVNFVILKAGQGSAGRDPLLRAHYNGARAAGMTLGVYHWNDPLCADQAQMQNLLRAIEGLQFDFTAVDVEQNWASWSGWGKQAITRLIDPQRIADSALAMAEAMRADLRLPTLIYTRASFVHTYARPMLRWLADWPLWLAHYPYPGGSLRVDWETFTGQHLPHSGGPALPEHCPQWTFWQFSGDRFILPGCSTALDLNLFNGSPAELAAWCGQRRDILPVYTAQQKLERLWAAHPELAQP
jgi:lysozyme